MAPVISAANIRAVAPETMEATSVALPEENTNDTSTTVKVAEEEVNGAVTYWWGTASQATAKIGGAITKISDRHSVIFDSPIEEGYENKKTSSSFEINTNYAAFDMANQDLMFYIELPEAASSLRMKHICADGWGKWPKPEGMKYRYLAADGTTWQEGVIAAENEVKLTPGFKGWVRLLLNTATNCESYQNASIELQFFAFRIGAFGGSYGPAKLGGVWFVSKGEAYKVSVDGGSEVSLTTAEPQPSTGGDTVEEPAWTGDVMTGNWFTKEWNDAGSDSTLISVSDPDKFAGIATQATSRSASAAELTGGSSRVFGLDKISVVDSPVKEGYFCDENKTYPIFTVSCAWKEFDLSKQDVMFYLELPAESSSIRFTSIYCNSGSNFWPQFRGMQMQYLSLDSLKWVASIPDANGQLNLPQGFKGYVRMKLDTATNASSFPGMTAKIVNFVFRPDRIGGDYGALKFGAAWFVTKEDTRYVKMDGGETSRLSDPVEPTWLSASVPNQETAEVGQTSAWLTWSDNDWVAKGWSAQPEVTLTAGEAINPIGTQKSVIIDSPNREGYASGREDGKNTAAFIKVNMNNCQLNIAEQDVLFYLELPAGTSSIRVDSISFDGGTMTPAGGRLPYQYLALDGEGWVDGQTDDNKQVNLADGFKGYIRLRISEANGCWWLNHDGDDSWKSTTRPMDFFTFRCARYGGDYGALKFGGVWFVSKGNFTDISVNGADAVAMTTHAASEPVMQATSVAVESDPVTTWDSKVSYTDNDSWKTVDSKAQITVGDSITRISSRKSVVIDSEIPEGYHNDGTTTWPMFRIATSATMNADEQDLMLYVELPATMSSLRIQDVTCRGWKFWLAPGNMQFKYLAMDSNDWVEGTISNDGNKQINLSQGFKGYIRLVLSSASNYSELGENVASLWIDALHFRAERFGGGLGALKLGGVWFVSKTDTYMVSVDGGEAVKMTDAPDPVDPSEPPEPSEPEPPAERDYLLGSMVSQESADIGAASTLIDINKNEEFWGIASQATATAADGITIIGEQKSVTIDSPIEEGFGNSKTSPLFTVSCGWQTLDLKSQDVMFYVEMPATGSGKSSLRIWDLTCDSWSFWVNTRGMHYQYLAIDGSEWVNGAAPLDENNKQLDLPDGFKGYVRLKIDTAKNVADKETLKVQSFSFYAGTFGGDYGPIKFGGVWFVTKEDFITIQVDGGKVVKMTKASTPGPNPDDRDYLIATMPTIEEAEKGEKSTLVTFNDNDKWWGKDTQSTAVAGEPITIIGDQKSVIIDSPIEEGYGNKQTSTLYTVSCGWKNLDTAAQDLMFYVELPEASSGLRIWDFTCNNWSFWIAPGGMKYQYLEMDSNKWQNGAITNEGNKQLDLPAGFKGYVRLQINTAGNVDEFPATTLQIQSFSFRGDTFGGDYGPIKIGGVWFVSKEEYIKIKVDNGEVLKMTNASDPGPVDPVDPIDPVDPDDPNRDYIIGSIPARETAANGKTSRLISMNDSTKWWGIPTQSTLVAGDPITIIGDQKSVIFDSPILEGYENKRTSALYTVNCGWTDLNLRTQDVMFYIEMPTSGRGSSGLRLWDLACDNYTFWVNTRGMKYQYLSMDSKDWVDGQIDTSDNKQIDLPDGFKGYVRLKVDTAANTADKETLKIQTFSFRPGTFGAEYGPIKFGGVWFVTKENFCYIRVDGAAKKVMTTYWQHNDELLDEFRELIEKLTDKNLSAAPTVDRLQSLYESMSKEYREKVTREELNRLNEYAAVIAAYRPEFIGATLKKYGSKPQSAKIGWTVDEALAKKGGYKVVSSGSVMIFGRSYDGKSLIDETTPASVKMTGKTASGYYYATTDIEAGDYKQAMLLRCYVIYEDSKTGKQYTVWCGMYTDKSGQTTPYMKCSLYEVAAYFGVPLYAN